MGNNIAKEIKELREAGLQALPLKHAAGKFIHPENYSKYYQNGIPQEDIDKLIADGFNDAVAVMHGPACPDLVCIDFDEKNAPDVKLFETWRNLVDDDIYRKLVIERTKSAGYHAYFKCKNLPPQKALASSPDGKEWIAIRSSASNVLTYCAPSHGYTEWQGSIAYDLPELDDKDLFALCSAAAQLNEYTGRTATSSLGTSGKMLPAVSIPHMIAPIVEAFDRYAPEGMIPELLQGLGWSIGDQVRRNVKEGKQYPYQYMWRPERDTKEAHSANYFFETRRLSVFSTSTPFPAYDSGNNFSHKPSEVVFYLSDKNWSAAVEKIKELSQKYEISLPEELRMVYGVTRGKTTTWQIEHRGIIAWATHAGFRWMPLSNEQAGGDELVRVVDNVIYDSDEKGLINAYRKEIKRNYPDAEEARVLERFAPQVMKYMDDLPKFNEPTIRDGKGVAYFYFNNGALKITAEDAKLISYAELGGCVFSKYIKPFDYTPADGHGVFGKFIDKITFEDSHRMMLMSVLGYVMHSHKERNNAKAVMILEDVEDQEEARGRSGKGLLAQFVMWMRWTISQDGRNFKHDSQFKMQRITPGVQVYYLNDPGPGVLMNQLYNYITDDWLVEQKGKKAYDIPFGLSPKIMITTNYLPHLESDSDKDRFIVMLIKKHFGAGCTVKQEFPGVIFFSDDWGQDDRAGAVRFAVDCIRLYLQDGVINYKNEQIEANAAKRVISAQVPGFIVELLEQAMKAAQEAKKEADFLREIKGMDEAADEKETLIKALTWGPGVLTIVPSQLFRYCQKVHKSKLDDKQFGKRITKFIRLMKWTVKAQPRNNATGRRIEVRITPQEVPAAQIVPAPEWEPVEGNDDELPF